MVEALQLRQALALFGVPRMILQSVQPPARNLPSNNLCRGCAVIA
jgi:hypothetical protein